MTDTIMPPDADLPAGRFRRRRSPLGMAVATHVQKLQNSSLADKPDAVRILAILRRAVGTPPGAAPDAWHDTIGFLPDNLLGSGDDPSASELAAHHAMTLFALHRQGRTKYAHVSGHAPGSAFAQLSRRRGNGSEDEGVRRRFDALVTATTAAESAHHLRGLILLARAEDIGLDYGYLADDLADLWTPRHKDRVRLRWARQYRGIRSSDQADTTAEDPIESIPEEQS